MNILFLSNHLNTGGITSYLLSLSKGLARRGHTVYISSGGGNCLTRFTEQGIVFIRAPLGTKSEINLFVLLPAAFILARQCREKEIDVIHANTRVTQVLARIVSSMTGIPFVSTCHGFFKKRVSRRVFPCWGLRVIAISEPVLRHCIDDLGADGSIVRLVHSGVDLEGLKLSQPQNRAQVRNGYCPGSGPLVSSVGRFTEEKGQEFLIRAMPSVLARIPDARLLLVGEGRTEPALRRLAAEVGVQDAVTFAGRVNAMRDVYYITDVFVLASLQEGLGLGLMEAMAWGKPVVGTSVGGIRDLIRDGENGKLVRPGDPRGIAEAVIWLLEHPDKAATLGHNARICIEERFPLHQMVSGTEAVYKECAEKRGSS